MRIFVIVSLLVIPLVRAENSIVTTDVCSSERKNISCSSDSVIYVDSARFGRMTRSTCLRNTGFGHLNCSADVRLYLERKCAGRRMCLLQQDNVLDRSNHRCPGDLKIHLEVSYHCLRVETPHNADSSKCAGNKYPVGMATRDGYLARVVTVETGIGSITCPWLIEARSGQTIRLTLYDFGLWQDQETATLAPSDGTTCQLYASINERSGSAATRSVCGGDPVYARRVDRGRVVYTSNSNSVQVTITTKSSPTLEQFLLKYEVVGCADPDPPPPHTHVERISDRLIIKCSKDSGLDPEAKTWTIQCLDAGNWSAPLHEINCSTTSGGKYKTSTDFPGCDSQRLIIWIPLVLLIAFITAFAFVVCHIVIQKLRKRKRLAKQGASSVGKTCQPSSSAETYATLNPEYLTANATYAQIAVYEPIGGDETHANAN